MPCNKHDENAFHLPRLAICTLSVLCLLAACNITDDHGITGVDAGNEDAADEDGNNTLDSATTCEQRESDLQFCQRVPDECGFVVDQDNCGDQRQVDCSAFVDFGCTSLEECVPAESETDHNSCECIDLDGDNVESEICEHGGAECGTVSAAEFCAGWSEYGEVDCGQCPDGDSCGQALANICGCPCEINGTCYARGDRSPDDQCAICDPDRAEDEFSDAPDGLHCDDDDPCTYAECHSGQCTPFSICDGTPHNCGCATCIDCTEQDGWYPVGDPYGCCDEGSTCLCQNEELRRYHCSGVECDYQIEETQIIKSSCSPCLGSSDTPTICSQGECVEDCGSDTYCEAYGVCADLDNDDDHCGACGNDCSSNETCTGGNCECVPNCVGKDCGSDGCSGSCGSCSSLNGWYAVGDTYSCCEGGVGISRCLSCQDLEYHEYSCDQGSCNYEVTDTDREEIDCADCPDGCACENGECPGNLCPT